ncbi:DUF4184 family protein [Actinokineospora xionganensis]|uniref:DUF4184 family protein n=1 Tax=Actinokineospora xionganensis TaxID=2684470 RepID=A0ABR7L5Y7_9PSEU|nr:DUF4184 family protein [Actinokineospora xionganensis]MBC6448106.1 DUF4184 family protein [Actinokineospora xionganensis]
MPFTLAHPAAVLPLFRYGTPSAMVAGALAPDLPYFLALRPVNGDFTHSLAGIALTLPIAIALLILWHAAMEPAVAALSPRRFIPRPPKPGISLVVSAVVGILTHLIWDNFTHGHGYFVERVPLLRLHIWPEMPIFFFLQVACSFVGLSVIAAALAGKYRKAPRKAREKGIGWVLAAAAVTAAYAAITGMAEVEEAVKNEVGIVRAAVGATSGLVAALVVHGFARRNPFRRADAAP